MSKYNGGPAFPITYNDGTELGLTKREWLAGMAMTAMGYTMTYYGKEDSELANIASTAFRMADAMLAEGEKE